MGSSVFLDQLSTCFVGKASIFCSAKKGRETLYTIAQLFCFLLFLHGDIYATLL